ncbi:MAG: hypothetical protein HY784_00685 [Chloroflexi bacterium]|nr:hypothetical protein [Chloroflexota bacterium]
MTTRGVPVPALALGGGDDFSLLFYAEPQPTEYSRSQIYWIGLEQGPAPRMAARRVEAGAAEPPAAYPAALNLEQNKVYLADAPAGLHWVWQVLTAPAEAGYSFQLSAVAPAGPATLQMWLLGGTTGEHRVLLTLNGRPVGELRWQGRTAHSQSFTFDAGLLRDGENNLTLSAPGDGSVTPEVDLFDRAALTYPRRFEARGGALGFTGAEASYALRGMGAGALLLDVTDPASPRLPKVSGASPVQLTGADGDPLSFSEPLPGPRRYFIAAPAAFRRPESLLAAAPTDLSSPDRGAEYLILAHASLLAAVEPLAAYRAAQGLAVRVIDVQAVYDTFGDGAPDPHAIRAFLRHARTQWPAPAPRFVLLVGKASYDYHNNLSGRDTNLLPVYLVDTPHLGQAASDNWYVAGEDGLRPALAIGRLPAANPEQLAAAVRKIIAYEAGAPGADWRQRALFVADDKDPGFDAGAERLAARLTPGIQPVRVYLSAHSGDLAAARGRLISEWNQGALLLTYVGHGAVASWAAGPLFSAADLPALHNGERLPILLTPTCLDGFFYHPQVDSLAEALLFSPQGGVVAALAPTGLSIQYAQEQLMIPLFDQLFRGGAPTLGEAIMLAKLAVTDPSPEVREVLDTFTLLGDPALRWAP